MADVVRNIPYDGRYSALCKDACDEGTCTSSLGEPYGCGSCCGCLGGCVRGYEEQMVEARPARGRNVINGDVTGTVIQVDGDIAGGVQL